MRAAEADRVLIIPKIVQEILPCTERRNAVRHWYAIVSRRFLRQQRAFTQSNFLLSMHITLFVRTPSLPLGIKESMSFGPVGLADIIGNPTRIFFPVSIRIPLEINLARQNCAAVKVSFFAKKLGAGPAEGLLAGGKSYACAWAARRTNAGPVRQIKCFIQPS